MNTRTDALATNDCADEHTPTERAGLNAVDALLAFYGIIAVLTGAFLASIVLAVRFSEHNNEPAAHVCGWAALAFFVADMLYIGLDWER